MKQPFAAFLARLLAYAVGLCLAWIFLRGIIPPAFYYEYAWVLVLFFFTTTASFHYGLLASAAKNNRSVVRYYMLSTAVKLMLYFLVMVGYSLARPGTAVPFISNFFVLYVFFTVFEVSVAYRHFRAPASPTGMK